MLELLEYSFFRNALAGVLLLSIGAGILGTYIVTRRMVSIAGGITHACFGGLDWVTSSGSRRCSWRRFLRWRRRWECRDCRGADGSARTPP